MKNLARFLFGAAVLASGAAMAQDESSFSDSAVKIGVLGDMSGVYAAGYSGPGSVAAVKMAIADYGGSVDGKPITVVEANHQNKPSIASSIAREWIDNDGVDMITDMTNSAAAGAIQKIAAPKKVITFATGPLSTALTNKDCTKYAIHYSADTYSLATGTATAIVQEGGEKWFFITADYDFGISTEKNATRVIKRLGGEVVGSVRAPLGTNDFSSYLLQAQSSGAQVIGLANGGQDTVNAVKQANEYQIVQGGQKLAGLAIVVSDLKSMGMDVAQGLTFTVGWYWDRTKESRDWTKRYLKYSDGAAPTYMHAAVYSATMTYLRAVDAVKSDDADKVRAQLGKMKVSDMFADAGRIRKDGVFVHNLYLVRAKSPDQSKGDWDVAKVIRTISGDKAFQPLSDVQCDLVN